jgi:hypothetical protein
MRFTSYLLFMISILLSCNNTDSDQSTSQRIRLISELKKLGDIFGSGEKEMISQIFTFPLSDTSFRPFVDDSTFMEELNKNEDKITRAMFIKYFSEISKDLQFDKLLKHFSLDSLAKTDKLEYEIRSPNQPCYKFHNLDIEGNEIRLSMGSNTNEKYNDAAKEDTDESTGAGCEFAWIWLFRFDGTKLHFERLAFAG